MSCASVALSKAFMAVNSAGGKFPSHMGRRVTHQRGAPTDPGALGAAERCTRLPCREATPEEIGRCHTVHTQQRLRHMSEQAAALTGGPLDLLARAKQQQELGDSSAAFSLAMAAAAAGSQQQQQQGQVGGSEASLPEPCVHMSSDTYVNRHTSQAAHLAAGASIEIAVAVTRQATCSKIPLSVCFTALTSSCVHVPQAPCTSQLSTSFGHLQLAHDPMLTVCDPQDRQVVPLLTMCALRAEGRWPLGQPS